jgi:uncharacterized RDD family membrane protein YckC
MARAGRRIVALFIDWGLSLLISNALLNANSMGTLAVFAVMQIVLIGTAGFSIGHRIAGIHVVRVGGGRVTLLDSMVRTVLLCLVIPVAITDADHRGAHDRARNTMLIRR